eukprot:4130999-Pleurochrysis_carterae.AAC.1
MPQVRACRCSRCAAAPRGSARACAARSARHRRRATQAARRTVFRAVEDDVNVSGVVVDEGHLEVAHHSAETEGEERERRTAAHLAAEREGDTDGEVKREGLLKELEGLECDYERERD